MISAEEMERRADEALDEWRSLDVSARSFKRPNFERRLADIGYPPDVVGRWLDSKRPKAARAPRKFEKRPEWPAQIR